MQLSHSENTYNEELVEKSLWISLSNIHGVGSQTFCQLLKTFGNPANIYAANHIQLKEVVSDKIAAEITKGVDEEALRETLHWLSQANNHLVTLADSHYPKALLEISDPPPFLYAKGNLALLNQPSIAIVGSRNASVQGEKNAEAFAQGLSGYNLCIVSGLALGIDGAAHRGALKANGATIAVVGTGLDIVYPAKHRDLAHQIVERGLIISEFALGTPSKPQNFPKRNRIISGLSLGCLVVEANLQSGSQITARLSAEQGREVFAIPGSIHSPMSKGCHQLIKQGAKLVDCLQDIVEELDLINATENVAETSNYSDNKGPPQNSLLTLMGYEPITLENIVHLSGLTVSEVSSMLMLLELEGSVASLAGGQYQKIM
ncbi:DNA-processing protein DprA [Methylotenera sp.]|uniref:DNA-processing protein DprA n=1 Tax=Methylotenera sp. TaxID=2051956 RepID=UPI002721CEE3|nr:DNA-processing protein DprA [Methylotenera sp.]MDO9204227.1 DNA-processing protein DprA [Methylotenera sp.]MDP1523893.1 DNA-processing protein DprA [Methylotenera sp.]MDP3306745.1 DNA-processing protein DprA [Methylotenera sp.]MDP3818472.1 DNA-processing protein DprA [Methylotenera sp.]MDZ4212123.1 DNA-processing protein DprA [Methylotenera sp.]